MNGKGSSPRSCFSRQFRTNYSAINWSRAATGQANPSKPCRPCSGTGSLTNLPAGPQKRRRCRSCQGTGNSTHAPE